VPLLGRNDAPQFERGVWPDLGNDAAPLIVDARNVRFDVGQVSPVPGAKLVLNTNVRDRVRALLSQYAFGKQRIWVAFAESLWELNETQFVQRSTIDQIKQLAAFGNFTLLVNGGQLHARKTLVPGGFSVVEDSPDNIEFVAVTGPYVLLFGERTIYWCHTDDIDNWDFTNPDSRAGFLPIRDMDTEIAAVLPYMNGALVLSQGGWWNVQMTGGDFTFGVTKLQARVGTVGREAVCSAKGMIYGLAREQFWVSDGVTHDSLDNPMFHDKLFRDLIEPTRISESVVWYDAANDRVVLNFPAKGTAQDFDGAAWNLSSRNWSPLTTGYCSVDRGNAWPSQLMGTVDGFIYGQGAQVLAPQVAFRKGLITRRLCSIGWTYGLFAYGDAPYGAFVVQEPLPTGRTTAQVVMTFVPADGSPEQVLDVVQEGLSDEAWVETKDQDFGTDQQKYVDQLVVKLEGASDRGSLFLRVAVKDRMNEPTVWSSRYVLAGSDIPVNLTRPDGRPGLTARYFRYRIEDDFVRARWKLTGIDTYGRVVGGRMS
jgi:hypothetical protein